MKFRLTISRKIGAGFAVLLISTLVIFILTYGTLGTARGINDKINKVYNPSVSQLESLKSVVLRSRTLINMWAFVPSREDTKEKMTLVNLIKNDIPESKKAIDGLSTSWTEGERLKKERIYKELDQLLEMYSEVQLQLSNMQSYDDPSVRFAMGEIAEEEGLIFQQAKEVIKQLNELISEQRNNTNSDSIIMLGEFQTLENYLQNMGIGLLIFGAIIAIFTALSITRPVGKLKHVLLELGQGKFPTQAVVHTGDEVGEMSLALDQLIRGLKRTTAFANQVGEGNFETQFEPLSDEDVLGNALLVMRNELNVNQQKLELKVEERTRTIDKSNRQLKELLESITASIRYAKRLQENILPSTAQVKQMLPDSFIYYVPKDIVSGDFYFIKEMGEKVIVSAVDCTGHGVPGAFMSLVGHNALTNAIAKNPNLNPANILTDLSDFATVAMNRMEHDESSRDGMDMALCIYDRKRSTLEYSGAFNPLYLVRNKELIVTKPDKLVIGAPEYRGQRFTNHKFDLQKGDMIYIFSDGYVDQFGGVKGKKFYYEPFRELLVSIAEHQGADQHERIANNMESWRMGNPTGEKYEQVDDMLVMGFKHT